MAILTCTNQRLIDWWGSINLNAKDEEGNLIRNIDWEAWKVTQEITETLNPLTSLTYESVVTQGLRNEAIAILMVNTGNFTLS